MSSTGGAAKAKKTTAAKPKRKLPAALKNPYKFDSTLAAVIGTTTPQTSANITKLVWVYIKKPSNNIKRTGHIIHADAKLKALCGKSEIHMMKDLAKCVWSHIERK